MVARWFRVLDVEGLGIGSCLLIKKGGNPGEEKEAILLVRIVEGLMDEVVKCLRRFRV